MQDTCKTREIEQIKLVSENKFLKEETKSIKIKLNEEMNSKSLTRVSCCFKIRFHKSRPNNLYEKQKTLEIFS